jgi:23S rRNA pseudouridine1911/1915/1917 synthase
MRAVLDHCFPDRLSTSPAGAVERFVVPPQYAGQRLDRVLASLSSATRSHIKVLVEHQRVRVAGEAKKAAYLVRAAEEIEVFPLSGVPTTTLPQDIPLEILYEDACLAAINKPPGLVVHPAPGQWQGTVVNALLFRWGRAAVDHALRPGIIHRLDKDTSGVLLVAKDEQTLGRLAHQFKERQVRKTYIAIVRGQFPSPVGEIVLPIGRHPIDRKKMSVHAKRARAAVSRYRVMTEYGGFSCVRLFPETGRTHQLRVHLAAVGHPIVGDQVYGARGALLDRASFGWTFPRQALHAESLEFRHPQTGQTVRLSAPLPADLTELLAALHLQGESSALS